MFESPAGRALAVLAAAAALAALTGCRSAPGSGEVSLTVDLRRGDRGTIGVDLETQAWAGVPVALSSFVQPAAMRVESIEARVDDAAVSVETARDEKGFARFVVSAPATSGRLHVHYVVRPGAVEEAPRSGPTGYRFGTLDRDYGLFGARQIVLLPMEPAPPARIFSVFRLPAGHRMAAPWPQPAGGATGTGDPVFDFAGADAAARLVQAVVMEGGIVTAESRDGRFRACALTSVPADRREAALRRALDLEEFLAARLGPPVRPYLLILAPRTGDDMSIAVTPGPDGMAMSLGDGLPTRWLSIGRAIGGACLAGQAESGAVSEGNRWILESLPTFLTVVFSDQAGWRPRQRWYEEFYYTTAGLSLDLRHPGDLGDATEPLMREWRGAQILELISRDLRNGGGAPLGDSLRDLRRRGRRPDWNRIVGDWPGSVRDRLARFLAASPFPFPFPGPAGTSPPIALAAPAPLQAAKGVHRLDLYAGGRNLGLLEQCGCRSRQAGGMARRATLLKRRLRGATPALAYELGDAVPFDQNAFALERQKIAESDLALSLMAFAGESASVVAHAELTYGPRFLAERVARLTRGFSLVSANVSGPGLRLERSLEMPKLRPPLRIIGIEDPESYHLGRPLEFEDAVAAMTIEEPVAAIRNVLDRRGPDGRTRSGLTIVAGALGPSAVLDIHAALPDLPLILTDDYFRFTQDPRLRFERPLGGQGFSTSGRLGKTLLVVLRTDSYALTRIGLAARDDGTIAGSELEDIVLDETIADDPPVRARLDAHYARLAAESGLAEPPPIGARLRLSPDATYTGAAACAPCHPAETAQWKATPHASAYATLLSKRRQGVPGCFACHVTGYRQPTGYRVTSDVALRHVQCESCHGPGSRHVKDPRRDNIVRAPAAAVCTECHTEKQSEMTEQNFTDYRAKIVHAAGAGDH